jgi:hypothetical protein
VLISEQGSTHRLTQLFLNKQGSFHSSPTQASCLGNAHTGFLRVRHRLHAHWTGLYTDSSGQHRLSFLYQDYARVSCRLASLDPPQDRRIEWMRTPPHGLLRLFYLHAPRLTLVTLGTACVPQRASPLHVPSLARNLG